MTVFNFDRQPATPTMPAPPRADQIEIRVNADAAWLPSLRVVAADLATRADFDLDEVADLRMAVDQACAELVSAADSGAVLVCRFAMDRDRITVTATVPVSGPTAIPRDTFGWRVLTTLVDEVEVLDGADPSQGAGCMLCLRLGMLRQAAPR
ncbi:MAG: ATP-binding protein [Pseudonocardiaceae bacterium]|nr:ATP-binding protein [Pseudonocardiaceae bacterium]